MKKPKTKQEMAEWLAEKVLGWECETHPIGLLWITPNTTHRTMNVEDLVEYFYSPDGFLAVIQSIDVVDLSVKQLSIIAQAWENFFVNQDYEAFYNAVWEAWQ